MVRAMATGPTRRRRRSVLEVEVHFPYPIKALRRSSRGFCLRGIACCVSISLGGLLQDLWAPGSAWLRLRSSVFTSRRLVQPSRARPSRAGKLRTFSTRGTPLEHAARERPARPSARRPGRWAGRLQKCQGVGDRCRAAGGKGTGALVWSPKGTAGTFVRTVGSRGRQLTVTRRNSQLIVAQRCCSEVPAAEVDPSRGRSGHEEGPRG